MTEPFAGGELSKGPWWVRRVLGLIPIIIFIAIGIAGLSLPVDAGNEMGEKREQLLYPSTEHWLGTDWLARDLFRRLLVGTRGFFLPGMVAMAIVLVLGTGLGALAGYTPQSGAITSISGWRRRVLDGLRSFVTMVLALAAGLPRFVSILLLCTTFGFDPMLLGISVGVLYAAEMGNDLRRRVALCSGEEYIEAAQAEGVPALRIIGYHILYLHCRTLILRHLVYVWSFCILVETSLSYIPPGQFGVEEPNPSWGNMVYGAYDAALEGHYWGALVPTLAILITVVLLARTGDRLSESDAIEQEGRA